MNRVVHFEIQADDMIRAVKFYEDVFGWEISKMEDMDYYLVMTAPKDSEEPGINGGILTRPKERPAEMQGTNAYVCTAQVDDYDDIAAKIEKAGGKVAMPKFDMMGVAWQGYFLDSEGNTFGIHQALKKGK